MHAHRLCVITWFRSKVDAADLCEGDGDHLGEDDYDFVGARAGRACGKGN